ncbi:MAG: hypothetical protein JWP12_2735 [Bacteroidetes bacterium]|nr:hypothetical protein [Bacteroidota bacterium]
MSQEETIKKQLYDHCVEYVNSRLNNIQNAIRSAQESANDDSKSSAGDKHETGRAMAQLEQEKLSFQLAETQKTQQQLRQINPSNTSEKIRAGSVVITNNGNYYISISAGKITVMDQLYFAVSPASPIGNALIEANNTQAEFVFNNQRFSIKKVF